MQKFLKEYIKNPKYIGAIVPSSKFLAKNMIESIDFNKKQYPKSLVFVKFN